MGRRESHNALEEKLEDRTVADDREFEVFGTVHNLRRRSAFEATHVLKAHSQAQSQVEQSSVEDSATGEGLREVVEEGHRASMISTWSFRCYQIL